MTTTSTPPAVLPPGFTAHTCVSVACGTCEHDYNDHEDISNLHFPTVADAITTITECGWRITDDGVVQCRTCAADQHCAEYGHTWPDWHPCGCGCATGTPRLPDHTQPMQYRWCESCHHGEDRPA